MKPLRLEFEGINSFSEHTIIDFESLTKSGIFGIFGDTGSGKSTILDCINFALYGNVKRSEVKTDIINYRSAAAKVNFTFSILNEGKRKIYTVERVLKKDKSGTHTAKLYEDDGESSLCIAEKTTTVERKIVEILGVEDEDFRKCIALPQGEFAQFVKSTPSARLALIERLFSLSKYGDRLKEKISERQREADSEYSNIAGRLQGYENVTQEAFKNLKAQAAEQKERLDKLLISAKAAAEKYEKIKLLNAQRAELEKTIKTLEGLNAEKQNIDRLRKGLSSLPECREVVNTHQTAKQKLAEADNYNAEISKLDQKLQLEASAVTSLEERLKRENFDERIAECVSLDASYKTCAEKPDKLKSLLISLEQKREEYRKKDKDLAKLLRDKTNAENAVTEAEQNLKSCTSVDIEQLVGVQFKGAVLKDEYAKTLNYFATLGGNLQRFEDESPLYEFISEEIKNKVEEYKQRVLAVKDFKLDAAQEQIKKLRQDDGQRENLQNELNKKKDTLQAVLLLIERAKGELETLQKDGAELRKRADELEEELKKVFGEGCNYYAAAILQNERALQLLRRQKQQLSDEIESKKRLKGELEVSLGQLKTRRLTATEEAERLNEKLNGLLLKGRFKTVEACAEIVEEFAAYPDAEKTLSEYDEKVISLTARRKELEKIEGIKAVTIQTVAAAEEEKENLDMQVKELTGSIAVINANCTDCEKLLKEKKAILKDFERVEKDRNLIAQLKELTKGNKFLEFIANEYLCDISAMASSTLLNLTDGRYFLTYKDNNFFVGDNYDCGNLRGVNTLSGGETFLVSLSLALALSQTICAKSLKSIEFFFLDEGFGTLDSTLVDTVMNALEKLKSSDFTIGVISHVEELKHRIESKITVIKATENHGSRVIVS